MTETLVAFLGRAAERGGPEDGLRFVDGKEQVQHLTWSVVHERVRRAAGALFEAGVRSGDRVALILPTSPGFVDAWLGCQWLGAIPVALYPPARLGRLDEYFANTAAMLEAVGAVAVVTDRRVQRVLGPLAVRRPTPLGHLDASDLERGSPKDATTADPDQVCMVQFSSGTTVAPKPVALTHRQVLANATRIRDVCKRAVPADAPYPPSGCSWLPLYHDMGLIGCIVPALIEPGPLALIPPELFLMRPALWLRTISRFRATVSPAPNFAYGLCVDRIRDEELEGVDLSSWCMALNGAEPVSAPTLRAFEARFSRYGFRDSAFMPVYGLSEAALAVTFPSENRPFRSVTFDRDALWGGRAVRATVVGHAVRAEEGIELVSVGRPLPDFEVEVRGGSGPLPEGQVGRIWVRGPSLMQGYLGRGSPLVDGWLDTGDQGFWFEGEIYVSGREKDVLVHRGRNVSPVDLERAADRVAGVRTGCSVAVADIGAHGERIVLFVEVRAPREGLADDVLRAVRAATGVTVDLVVQLDPGTLPRTSSGKLRRSESLDRWRARTLVPPDRVTPWLLAGAMARSTLAYWRTGERR